MDWIFQSPQRLRNTIIASVLVSLVLLVALTGTRIMLAVGREPTVRIEASEPALTPSATATTTPAPTPTSSTPIALEAAQAFLAHDLRRFATLATPEAMEAAGAAPAPSQRLHGDASLLRDGPTRQDVRVPTTGAALLLNMVLVDGAWLVEDMRFES